MNCVSFEHMKKEWKKFLHAFSGLGVILRSEPHFRFHLMAAIVVTFIGWYIEIKTSEWLVLLLCFGFVLMAEAFNSAIEELADAVTLEHHPKIKRAKDIAAGAVLLSAMVSVVVGALIFFPRLI